MALPPAVPPDTSDPRDWIRKAATLLNALRLRAPDAGSRPVNPGDGQVWFDKALPGLIYWDADAGLWRWAGSNEAAP